MSDTQGFAALLGELSTFAAASVRMAAPLLIAGLGEAISETAGILNIGLEGIMLSGAFAAFIVAWATQNVWLGIMAGIAGGMLASLLHALLGVGRRADQTITGLALNFLASGLTSYFFLMAFGRTTSLPECPVLPAVEIPLLSSIPFFGPVLFSQNPFVYFAFVATGLVWLLFRRSEWGVILHAAGENPHAADSAGLDVIRTRYVAAAANGCFGGLAGASITLGTLGFFMENVTSGKGYIALVVVILGRRQPFGVALAALLLGAADALQFRMQTGNSGIPSQVFIMFPYLMTVIVLLFSIGKTRDPASLGIPFDRGRR
jgi:simple sugar transport system permease protein